MTLPRKPAALAAALLVLVILASEGISSAHAIRWRFLGAVFDPIASLFSYILSRQAQGLPVNTNAPAPQLNPFVPINLEPPPAGGADSAPAPTPPPVPPGPPSPPSCPPTVSECDFYFQGFADSIPTFTIGQTGPDEAISPPVITDVQGATLDVRVLNAQNAEYICHSPNLPADNQFYVNGRHVSARTFQTNPGIDAYRGQTVYLHLTAVQLDAFNMTFNLNPGQDGTFFPEQRRCLIFNLA